MKATHVRATHYVKLGSLIKDIDILALKEEQMLIKVYLREKCNEAYVSDSYLHDVVVFVCKTIVTKLNYWILMTEQ